MVLYNGMDYTLNLFPCSCYYSRCVHRMSILQRVTMAVLMNSFQITELRWCLEDKEPCNTVEPRSIVPVSIVFPHLPFAIFGPEKSSI